MADFDLNTYNVAESLADGADGIYDDGMECKLGASVRNDHLGRVELTVTAYLVGEREEEIERKFRFLGEEVRK